MWICRMDEVLILNYCDFIFNLFCLFYEEVAKNLSVWEQTKQYPSGTLFLPKMS